MQPERRRGRNGRCNRDDVKGRKVDATRMTVKEKCRSSRNAGSRIPGINRFPDSVLLVFFNSVFGLSIGFPDLLPRSAVLISGRKIYCAYLFLILPLSIKEIPEIVRDSFQWHNEKNYCWQVLTNFLFINIFW